MPQNDVNTKVLHICECVKMFDWTENNNNTTVVSSLETHTQFTFFTFKIITRCYIKLCPTLRLIIDGNKSQLKQKIQ